MRIVRFEPSPIRVLAYRNAVPVPGGTRDHLPLMFGEVECASPAAGLEALLLASDLQGRTTDDRLLGEWVPQKLLHLSQEGLLPPLSRIGVLLCGDLYAKPGGLKLGGSGDVRPVWRAFAAAFRWVVGVAGNHDQFGSSSVDFQRFLQSEGAGFLDGSSVERDGVTIAGISGVIGNPERPFSRTHDDFAATVDRLLLRRPDVLLMHDGPDDPDTGGYGIPAVKERLLRYPRSVLVVRGHSRWKRSLVQLSPTCQVVNADAKLVVLRLSGVM